MPRQKATAPPSDDMASFKKVLSTSTNIIAVAGAGLSAASGIPTFRGAGGMWRKFDAMSLATPEAFDETPSRVWQFYHYRREKAASAEPNAAHIALAKFSLQSIRDQIAPESHFTLITQNVDGLSVRALKKVLNDTGKTQDDIEEPAILEMHGRLFDIHCTSSACRHKETNLDSPICSALGGTEDLVDAGVIEPNISLKDLPRCSNCGSLARPGVVWFGEVPQYMDQIDQLVNQADLCIVVGTSSTVQPAASYAFEVKANGGKVAVFNLERSHGDSEADFLFLGPCSETLSEALGV
ncbi:DHS-like NAD/FAD-binding domain-containing protein [Rickenella mellea]|uniref:NAD-dependent protein deacylase n=1 Tax=Rickenella mellea TaxID=50990 RepID=A0A4R5XE37_9AGAM|nr:DHS-like NAD/FAD-binding domain-containing protein [Rickenella mellea]